MSDSTGEQDTKRRDSKKKGSHIKKRLFPIGFMFVITLVFISVTTIIYTFTKDTIELNETIVRKRSILFAAGVEIPTEPREIDEVYNLRVEEARNEGITYYRVTALDSEQVESYVVIVQGAGLWGTITAAVGYRENLQELAGIEIIDQNETPGLGGRIGEPWFKRQFRGKTPPLSTVGEDAQADENQFQAITGATNTTNAVRTIVNEIAEQEKERIEALQ